MARKRKSRKTHHRRRKVGAMALNASSPMVKYGTILLGYLLAKPLNTAIDGIIPASLKSQTGSPKIVAAGEAGIGALLVFSKGKKSLIKSIAGGVFLGAGLKRFMDSMATGAATTITGYGAVNVVSGYGAVDVISGKRKLGGYTPNAALNGYTPNAMLNGTKPVHQTIMGNVREGSGYME